jgi:hypothetical protein
MALPGIQSDDSSGAAGGISPDQAGQLDQPTNPRGEQGLTVQQKIAQMGNSSSRDKATLL